MPRRMWTLWSIILLTAGCSTIIRAPETDLERGLQHWLRNKKAVTNKPLVEAFQPESGGAVGALVSRTLYVNRIAQDGALEVIRRNRGGPETAVALNSSVDRIPEGTVVSIFSFALGEMDATFQVRADLPRSGLADLAVVEIQMSEGYLDQASLATILSVLGRALDFRGKLSTLVAVERKKVAAEEAVQQFRARFAAADSGTVAKLTAGEQLWVALQELIVAREQYGKMTGAPSNSQDLTQGLRSLRRDLDVLEELVDREAVYELRRRLQDFWEEIVVTTERADARSRNPISHWLREGRQLRSMIVEYLELGKELERIGGGRQPQAELLVDILLVVETRLTSATTVQRRGCRERPLSKSMLRQLVGVMPDSGLARVVRACGLTFQFTDEILKTLRRAGLGLETSKELRNPEIFAWPPLPEIRKTEIGKMP